MRNRQSERRQWVRAMLCYLSSLAVMGTVLSSGYAARAALQVLGRTATGVDLGRRCNDRDDLAVAFILSVIEPESRERTVKFSVSLGTLNRC